ncbi:protein of unknown function [Tenacibaculum insulae]
MVLTKAVALLRTAIFPAENLPPVLTATYHAKTRWVSLTKKFYKSMFLVFKVNF